jgi:hypothetical protein
MEKEKNIFKSDFTFIDLLYDIVKNRFFLQWLLFLKYARKYFFILLGKICLERLWSDCGSESTLKEEY